MDKYEITVVSKRISGCQNTYNIEKYAVNSICLACGAHQLQ